MTNQPELNNNEQFKVCSFLNSHNINAGLYLEALDGIETILIEKEQLLAACNILKTETQTAFDVLISVSGLDIDNNFWTVYHLYSTKLNKKVVIKTLLDRDNPQVQSLSGLYKAADWHERETYDLFGIKFLNHPNLERILMPKDWIGYPLRKDYKLEDERLSWNQR